jgi:hypothetical protein
MIIARSGACIVKKYLHDKVKSGFAMGVAQTAFYGFR